MFVARGSRLLLRIGPFVDLLNRSSISTVIAVFEKELVLTPVAVDKTAAS